MGVCVCAVHVGGVGRGEQDMVIVAGGKGVEVAGGPSVEEGRDGLTERHKRAG